MNPNPDSLPLVAREPELDDLQVSEAHLPLLINSIKDYAIFLLDRDGRIATWNAGAERIKGYRLHDVRGRHISMFYTAADREAGLPESLLAEARARGRVESEGWRVRKDGTLFWADVVITAVRNSRGDLIGYGKVTRDLSERRAAEEARRQSEERFRTLIDGVRDYAIFMVDPTGVVASWNHGAERLLGYRADEIVGQSCARFYPPEDVEKHRLLPELLTASRLERIEAEGWRVRKDGSRFWANVIISAARSPQGELKGFTKVTRDMTDRKRAEEQVAIAAAQQAAVAALGYFALECRSLGPVMQRTADVLASTLGVPGAEVCALDASGELLVTRAIAGLDRPPEPRKASGGSAAVAAMQTGEAVIVDDARTDPRFAAEAHALDRGAVGAAWTAVRSGGRAEAPFGAIGVHVPAGRRFTEAELGFLKAMANVLATAVARQRADEAIFDAQRAADDERLRVAQAESAVRERDEFISIASHELRTPLTAMKLKLQALRELVRRGSGEVTPEKLADRMESTLRQTDRLNRLIERLLDVTRIAADRLELICDPFDLGELLTEIAESFREQALQARCDLTVRIPGPIEGCWDRSRLEQAIANLVSNAIKYGAGKPIEIAAERDLDVARVRVTDHGIGLSESDAARIFNRFSRVAPLRGYGGLGLGLYISRHVVEAHGGTIRVTSRPGAGSTFQIEVPIATPATRDEQRPANALPAL